MKEVPRTPGREKRLCIDIGATRLKWSVLPRAINGEDFPGMQTYSMRTLGWLNSSLEDLLDPDNWSGINHARRQLPAYDSIGIGICTQLTASGKIFGNLRGRGVPADLKERFERQTGKPVILMNDAEAWLRGAVTYCESRPATPGVGHPGYPSVALVLGTGVGWAWAKDAEWVAPKEFVHGFAAPHLSKAAGMKSDDGAVHQVLGKPFFEWVDGKNPGWSYPTIREEFTKRVVALLQDVGQLRGSPRTIFICGGNAEYVSIREIAKSIGVPVIMFREPELAIQPDLVPLLGLAATC